MKVTDWVTYADAEDLQTSFGGLGGWFNASRLYPGTPTAEVGDDWAAYLSNICGDSEDQRKRAEALRAEILHRRLWTDGGWHQNPHVEGVPRFEDGTVASFSFRAWGDLMAAVWSEQLGRPYTYMDFYYIHTPPLPADFEARASRGVGATAERAP